MLLMILRISVLVIGRASQSVSQAKSRSVTKHCVVVVVASNRYRRLLCLSEIERMIFSLLFSLPGPPRAAGGVVSDSLGSPGKTEKGKRISAYCNCIIFSICYSSLVISILGCCVVSIQTVIRTIGHLV